MQWGKIEQGQCCCFLNTMAREGLTEQVTFEQHFRKYEDIGERILQAREERVQRP